MYLHPKIAILTLSHQIYWILKAKFPNKFNIVLIYV